MLGFLKPSYKIQIMIRLSHSPLTYTPFTDRTDDFLDPDLNKRTVKWLQSSFANGVFTIHYRVPLMRGNLFYARNSILVEHSFPAPS